MVFEQRGPRVITECFFFVWTIIRLVSRPAIRQKNISTFTFVVLRLYLSFSDRSTWPASSWSQICVRAVCREPPSAPRTSACLQERSGPGATQPTRTPQGEAVGSCFLPLIWFFDDLSFKKKKICILFLRQECVSAAAGRSALRSVRRRRLKVLPEGRNQRRDGASDRLHAPGRLFCLQERNVLNRLSGPS